MENILTTNHPQRPPLFRHFIRLFFLQALWNYRNLQGTGFLFSLIPYFDINKKDSNRDLVKYHGFFNTHPYLASLALGATLRREVEGSPDVKSIQDFHCHLSGPLGLIGDTLFWGTSKPNAALLSLLLAFLLYGDSVTPLIAAVGFLFVFNIPHLWMRWWGLVKGWQLGDRVLSALGKPPIIILKTWFPFEGAILLGLVGGAVFAHGFSQFWYAPLIVIGGALWAWMGSKLHFSVPAVAAIPLVILLIAACFL
jgi:PTS system mannose-specific IID component